MSFSSEVKMELEGVVPRARHCQIAEIAAILQLLRDGAGRGERDGKDRGVLLRTDNETAARKLFTLLERAFNIDVVVFTEEPRTGGRGGRHVIRVKDGERADAIRAAAGHRSVLNLECCRNAFLRGAFLAAGSLSAPEKYYHFEIVCPDETSAELVKSVLRSSGFDAKGVLRKKDQVVYLKEGDQIVALLGAMGASISFLNIESIRVMKEMRGSVNRRVNCETANLNKTIVSAVRQIEDIAFIRDTKGFGELSPALRQMAEIRLAYPDASLQELGAHLDPRIGKSGVNHRLRKLSAIADELRAKD